MDEWIRSGDYSRTFLHKYFSLMTKNASKTISSTTDLTLFYLNESTPKNMKHIKTVVGYNMCSSK